MRSIALLSFLAFLAPKALAQTPIVAYPPQNDTVSMALSSEDWVTSATAHTEIAIDAALPGSDAGKARGDMLGAVKGLAQNADWRFTTFDRTQDSSGLEHWHAVVETRLPESQLGGFADRAKQASRPGMQLKVQTIDFTPTLAETEAARAKLRGEMYKRVNDALSQLNQAEPDRKYRIESINFGAAPMMARTYNMLRGGAMAAASPAPEQTAVANVDVAQKIELTANVTFAAHAPTP